MINANHDSVMHDANKAAQTGDKKAEKQPENNNRKLPYEL